MKIFPPVIICITLAGCASAYTDLEYQETMSRVSLANICEREKLITQDDYNVYTAYQLTLGQQNGRAVDSARMQKLYLDDLERVRTLIFKPAELDQVRPYCTNIGIVAHKIRQHGTQQIPVWVPRTITATCMTTYGWTRCTSF